MAFFFDTSALAKQYHEEIGRDAVRALIDDSRSVCYLSKLGIVEMHSVIAMKVRSGFITADESKSVRQKFRANIRRYTYRVVALEPRHYDHAELLVERYGASHGLRALDSLQLASALDLFRNHAIHTLVASDRVLLAVAPLEGLTVLNPEVA